MLKAYRKSDGTEARRGDTVTDFRGENGIFEYATRAPGDGRTGKVMVNGGEYYQTVYKLEVRDVRGMDYPELTATAGTLLAALQVERADGAVADMQEDLYDALIALGGELRLWTDEDGDST